MFDFLKLANLFGAFVNFFKGEEDIFAKLFKLLLALDIAL